MELSPSQKAQLALLLEVSSFPKPGNVDSRKWEGETTFYHFLLSSVGSFPALRDAEGDTELGRSFYRAVKESHFHGENTHFGAFLLLIPLIKASVASKGSIERDEVENIVQQTTVEDAVFFYKSFNLIDIYVPPIENSKIDIPDVSKNKIEEVKKRKLTLYEIMEKSSNIDGIAREWKTGFKRTFETSENMTLKPNIRKNISKAYLKLLSEEMDTFVQKKHGTEKAKEIKRRAKNIVNCKRKNKWEKKAEKLHRELTNKNINPGTTADILCGSIYLNLDCESNIA